MKIEKKNVLALNRPLGIIKRPFAPVAKKLGWEETKLLGLIKEYKAKGVIRRLGFILAHRDIGFKSNALVVWKVPAKDLLRAADIFKRAPEISHCYERKTFPAWPYNVYTMVHGRSKRGCLKIISALSRNTGIKEYQALFTVKELKKKKADIWAPTRTKKKENFPG